MRNLLAPVPGIVQAVDESDRARRELAKLWVALQDAERVEESASQELRRRMLVLGQWLNDEREKYPKKGPKSKAWGDLLRDCGIEHQRASEAMRYAGYVEEVSPESGDTLPSLRDAGVDQKSRKVDSDADASRDSGETDWEVARMKLCERVKTLASRMPDEKKGDLVFSLRQLANAIEEMPTWKK